MLYCIILSMLCSKFMLNYAIPKIVHNPAQSILLQISYHPPPTKLLHLAQHTTVSTCSLAYSSFQNQPDFLQVPHPPQPTIVSTNIPACSSLYISSSAYLSTNSPGFYKQPRLLFLSRPSFHRLI